MLSYGPGPPTEDRRHSLGLIYAGARSDDPSQSLLNNFEEEFLSQQDGGMYAPSMPVVNSHSGMQSAVASTTLNETNPFETSFSPSMIGNPAMMRSASLGTYQSPTQTFDPYFQARRAAPPQFRSDLKRPRHEVLQQIDSGSGSSMGISSKSSSFNTAASTATSESVVDESSRRSSDESDMGGSRNPSFDNTTTYVAGKDSALPVTYENVARLNLGRLQHGYAQMASPSLHQPIPKALSGAQASYSLSSFPHQSSLPPPTLSTAASPPKIYAPLPMRVDQPNYAQDMQQATFAPQIVPPDTSKAPKKKSGSNTKRRSIAESDDGVPDYMQLEDLKRHPVNGHAPDESKRAQFLERNRLAACRSRQKKKEWVKRLESTAEQFATENQQLHDLVKHLRSELVHAREGCTCGAAQKHSSELFCLPDAAIDTPTLCRQTAFANVIA